jgi:uncharacterized protein YndB with AHSA1/START domain
MILDSATATPTEKQLLLKRVYKAPIHRVFRAFVDINDLKRWYTEQPEGDARVSDMNLCVGGGFVAAFGPRGETPWIERVQYREIDPPRRLLLLSSMTHDGAFICMTKVEIALVDLGGKTELTLIETGAEPAAVDDRAGGWGRTLDNLARVLG